MKALIVVNAYIKNSSQLSQAERIREELEKSGVRVEVRKNFAVADLRDGRILADTFDFCVFLDKDRVAARMLERSGMRLFNSARAIEVCDDKMLTYAELAGGGFNLPDSVYAPLCYYADAQINEEFLRLTAKKLDYPIVAKTNYGSLGAGVSLINTYAELCAYEEQNKLTPHFYQKFIGRGGEDVRVIVIGGKYLCAMKRSNPNDFRSNVELGGRGEGYDADGELISLCEGVADRLRLDYCGIDVISDDDGKRYVCEVNSNAFFAAAERVCKVNIAGAYAEYMKGIMAK